jgi:3-hydroxy-9,10-secoandrosta-1,3,5(10)-triene-9,17-dione monooxygenase
VLVSGKIEGDAMDAARNFLLPVDEVEVKDTWHVDGMAATGSRDIVATEIVVPERRVSLMPPPHLLAKPGDPYLHRIPIAPFLSLTAALPAMGAAKRALALFEGRLFNRVMFGTKRTQSARVPTQVRLANLRVEVDFAETLMRDVADRIQAHADGRLDLDLLGQLHLRLGIAHIVRKCRDVVREIMQSSGSSVHYLDNELQRIQRDVHMMCAHTVFDIDLVADGVGRQIIASKEAPAAR